MQCSYSLIVSVFILVSAAHSEDKIPHYEVLPNRPIADFQAMQDAGWFKALAPYLQMIDASTKIPSGIAGGSFYDMGNFDECYNLQTETVTGKYCLGSLTISLAGLSLMKNISEFRQNVVPLHNMPVTPRKFAYSTIQLHSAVCVPSSMSAEEINKFSLARFTEKSCYSRAKSLKFSGGAIATTCFFATLLGIAVVQTLYDTYIQYTKQKPLHELLIAFSFLTNGKKLIAASTNPDQLLCLNGIKALSMMWVVIGHIYSGVLSTPLLNTFDAYEWQENVGNMYIMGATVSVDTFFLVGGLVTVYTFLKATDKGVKFNIILYYIHRILRLTPAYAAVILYHINLLAYIEPLPLYNNIYNGLVPACSEGWWRSLLYIGNFFKDKPTCLGQGWYLNVDMQLFILSPLILIPLVKWRKYTIYALYGLIVLGCVIPFSVAYGFELGGMTDPNYMKEYYIQTYTRFGPYVIGMLVGYFIYENKKSKELIYIPKLVVCCTWIVTLAVLVTCVFAGHDMFIDPTRSLVENSFYIALNRPAWSIAVAALIYLCVFGYGGVINDFLSMHIFQFITKLSYSIYLVHASLIVYRYMSLKAPMEFSSLTLSHLFWGDFMFSLIVSLPVCLIFESPIIILEKYIFKRPTKKN